MPGLVVHIELLQDGIDLLALVGALGLVDVPLADLAVDEQRGVGIAAAIERSVQRAQAELGLGDHHVALLELSGKKVVELAHVDHRHRGRELAVEDDVDAVGRRVAAVRRIGHGDVARVFGAVAAVDHRHAVHLLEVALLDRFLDQLEIEDHGPVLLVGGHVGDVQPLFRVVAGGERVLALVVGVAVVQVAVHQHLPGDFHGLAIDGGEDGPEVAFRVIHLRAVVGQRHDVLAVGEDVTGLGVALRTQAVDAVGVGNLDDLVALHHVAAHARDAGVGLVVDEDVAPVIRAVGKRHVRVVRVAIGQHAAEALGELARGRGHALGHDLATFVGEAPAGGAVDVKDRNAHELAHRRHAQDADLAGLAARVEGIVVVELAGLDDAVLLALAFLAFLRVGGQRMRQLRGTGHHGARKRRAAQPLAATQPSGFLAFFISHHGSPRKNPCVHGCMPMDGCTEGW